MNENTIQTEDIKKAVRDNYANVARYGSTCGCEPNCCSPEVKLGYSAKDITSVPDGANMGLGCGNPHAIADLKPGEVVLDLGSGGGFDCFLASKQVGETGRVIGVDMTPEMLDKARNNVETGGYTNVEFRLGEIEHLPVEDNSVDVVMSNCVINLSTQKDQVYREIARVLRPGGRIAVSDIVAIEELPDEIKQDLSAYSMCIAGAVAVDTLRGYMEDAGLKDIHIETKPNSAEFIKHWLPGSGIEKVIASADIAAVNDL
jgi:arsenite methyltransferase